MPININAAAFSKELQNFATQIKIDTDQAIQKGVLDLFEEIKERTPIATGVAKGEWQIEFSPNVISILNNIEYISYLEDGHSGQAPEGMVAISLQKFAGFFAEEGERLGFESTT